MEKPSRSHDLGIMTDAHNHNTSKNSLGNKLKLAVVSHGGKSSSIFHGLNYLRVSSDYRFNGTSANWTLVVRFDENTISISAFMRITRTV